MLDFVHAMAEHFTMFLGVVALAIFVAAYFRSRSRMWTVLKVIFSRRPCPVLWIRSRVDLARFLKRRSMEGIESPLIVLDMESIVSDVEGDIAPDETRGHYGGKLTDEDDSDTMRP